MAGFDRSVAVVVGIDAYGGGIPRLETAVADARAIAELLQTQQGYHVELVVDERATRARLVDLFEQRLPTMVGANDRVLIYFAGHGTAADGEDGPEGFLVPHDAGSGDDARESLLPMTRLHHALRALPCRHRLLLLDCCFAGSFRWSSFRDFMPKPQPLYRQRYQRFIDEPAAQVLTSAAADQKALDVIDGLTLGRRAAVVSGGHSPFAAAVLAGLAGAADLPGPDGHPDGVITASELYLYVREVVERASEARSMTQTPGLWPLPEHGRGEYLFWVPGREPRLIEDPRLDEAANPWRGLGTYDAEHAKLFFGRDAEIAELEQQLTTQRFIAVLGASGTGKSSLVKGGLLPRLRTADSPWTVVGPIRPGTAPARILREATRNLNADASQQLLVVDQLEEVFTLACPPAERTAFFEQLQALAMRSGIQVIVTLRSDFEAQFRDTAIGPAMDAGRYVIPPMSREGLRDVIRGPAELRVLYFEPPDLVDALVDEVVALPGGLPLLSFTLAEMYRSHLRRDVQDRALTGADYAAMGGVTGALHSRATQLFDDADPAQRETIRRLMLRLVANEAGGLARRRASATELAFDDPDERERMASVVEGFVRARLLVRGTSEAEDGGEGYVEPAHDALVAGWDRIYQWLHEAAEWLPLQRAIGRAARTWRAADETIGLLWDGDPRLSQARGLGDELNGLEARFVRRSVRRRQGRRWTLGGIVLAVMATLLITTVDAISEARRADRSLEVAKTSASAARVERDRARSAESTANRERRRAEDAGRLAVAQRLLETDPTTAALVLADIAFPNRSGLTTRLLSELATRPGLAVTVLGRHSRPLSSATLSPDGTRVLTVPFDGEAQVWAVDGPGPPIAVGRGPAVFDSGGRRVVSSGEEGKALIWNADGRGDPVVLHHGGDDLIRSVAFSPDGSRVAIDGGGLRIWNADGTGRPTVLPLSSGGGSNWSATAFSPDSARVVAIAGANVEIWNADGTGPPVILRSAHDQDGIAHVAFSPDGRQVVTAPIFQAIARVWNVDGSGEPVVLSGHDAPVAMAVFSPDGARVATASGDGKARIWDADGAGSPVVLEGHTGGVESVSFDRAGARVVTGSADGTARIWKAAGGGPAFILEDRDDAMVMVPNPEAATTVVLEGHSRGVTSAAFSHDGTQIVTASRDGTARVWRIAAIGNSVVLDPLADAGERVVTGHAGQTTPADLHAVHDPSRRIVTRSKDNVLRVRTADGTRAPIRLPKQRGRVDLAALSPNGARVVTASTDGNEVRVWSVSGEGRPITFDQHPARIIFVAFDPRGERVLSGSWAQVGPRPGKRVDRNADLDRMVLDRMVYVWRADGGGAPVGLKGHTAGVVTAAFAPDGNRVVTAARDGSVRVFNADGTGTPIVLTGHSGHVNSVAFSPDGARVVAAGQDGTVRIWSADGTGTPVVLTCPAPVHSAAFSPDGERVITASMESPARIWNADGSGLHLVLEGHDADWAAFGPEGRHAFTPAGKGAVRKWFIDGEDLQGRLRDHLRWCLPQSFREDRLGQPADDAREAVRACQRRLAEPVRAPAPPSVAPVSVATAAKAERPARPRRLVAIRATATSVHPPTQGGRSRYGAVQAIDGDPNTWWQEGEPGDGVGESLVLSWSEPRQVRELRLIPGYPKVGDDRLGDRWPLNNRIARARIDLSAGADRWSTTVDLPDRRGWQTIEIDAPIKATRLRITIEAVHPGRTASGRRVHDSGIAEIRVRALP